MALELEAWLQNSALPRACCMTLGKSLNLWHLNFFSVEGGDTGKSKLIHVTHFRAVLDTRKVLAHSC